MVRQMHNGHTIVITSAWGHDAANNAIHRYNEGEITDNGLQRILWSLVGWVSSENHSRTFETEREAYDHARNRRF